MTGPAALIVISLGFLTSVAMVILAVRAGRVRPVHPWLWGIALTAVGAAALFHLVIGLGALAAGTTDAIAVLVGATALIGAVVLAVLRPAWAGWMLIGTGVGQPALLWLLQLLAGAPADEGIPAEGMLAFYGVPAVITGVLLLLSTWHRRSVTTVGTPLSSVQ